ncbi:hypothetical protein BHM03_00009030 [Ensete ventricosum]|nr:hypothetical protein BHM03_00009030 [Ensete ventricosum]
MRRDLPPRHRGSRYALALLHPHCTAAAAGSDYLLRPATALPRGDHPCNRRRCPCWRHGWPQVATPCRLAAAGWPLRAGRCRLALASWPQPVVPAGCYPLRAAALVGGCPL